MVQQCAVGTARQLGGFVPRYRPEGRRQDRCASGGRPGIRPESGGDRARSRKEAQHAGRVRPGLSAEHGGILQHHPRAQGRQARHRLCRVLSAGFGRHPARRERDRDRRQRQGFRRRHGRPAIRRGHGEYGLAAQRRRQLQLMAPGKEHVLRRDQGVLRKYTKRAIEAKVDPLGYYLAPFGYASGQLVEGAIKAVGSLDQKAIAKYLRENDAQDHRRPDRVFGRRRAQGNRGAAGPVPRRRGQEHRAVPQLGQAGDPVPGETEIRRTRQLRSRPPGSRPQVLGPWRGCPGSGARDPGQTGFG